MNSKKRTNGFTIIEMVIYMGLLSILIALMSQLFIATVGIKVESEAGASVQQDGNYIISRIAYDIHRASRIIAPALGQTGSTLSLGIIESGVEQIYTYLLANTTLTLLDGSTTDSIHSATTNVSTFSVTRVGNSATRANAKDTVQFLITISSTYRPPSGIQQMTFQSTAGLR